MLRLSKFADYGTQVMAYMAKDRVVHSASEVSAALGIAIPTVSKILKMLVRENLVASSLGAKGGYMLARDPGDFHRRDHQCDGRSHFHHRVQQHHDFLRARVDLFDPQQLAGDQSHHSRRAR
jgi:DNA-binding IclR family transcriptional regulator